jgi:CubicO group peptidase (beta-lactamase class C family)
MQPWPNILRTQCVEASAGRMIVAPIGARQTAVSYRITIMKKLNLTFLALFLLPAIAVSQQSLDEKLKEIDDYANIVMSTWKGPGMAIAIVKDDKVVFQKGYGMKRLPFDSAQVVYTPNSSPEEAYAQLFKAVKSQITRDIVGFISVKSLELGSTVASRNNTPIEKVFENGFTATTFAPSMPAMRDIRIKDGFASIEVFNAKEDKWEDLPFVFENGGWRLAVGDIFAGTFRSPGKSKAQIEREAALVITRPAKMKNKRVKTAPKPINSGKGVGFGSGDGSGSRNVAIVSSEVGGPKRPDTSNTVDADTVFAIASNSKAFTTAALAILVDEKKLNWDDKVSRYLPEFQMYDPWVTSELTIRDLVTHRVGLDTFSGDLLWYETTYSPDEILQRLKHLKPVSSFRTKFGYQNLMFIAAGKVIEKASGKTWCGFVTERILTPLGMTRTTCSVNSLPDNAAWPHNESGGKLRTLHRGNVDGSYAAAALNSSVNDLSKWLRLQLGQGKFEGKQIFSDTQSWAMHQPYLAQQISMQASKNNPTTHFSGVAMGWFVSDYHGRKIINHSGGLDGMLSYTVLIPEENAGFVVLTNNESPSFAIMMNKIRDVLLGAPQRDYNEEAMRRVTSQKAYDEGANDKINKSRVADTRPSLALSNYAGTYGDQLYGDVTLAEENGRLVMRFLPSPNFVADLEHWHYDTFVIKWRPSVAYNFPRGFVTFTIDQNGKTDRLTVDQPNNDFWFYELDLRRKSSTK